MGRRSANHLDLESGMHEGGERSPSSLDVFPCLKFLQAPSLAQSDVESRVRMEWKESRGWQVKETLYFHVTLEPHLKHSGVRTGGRILFLAEIPVDAAKKKATNPDDDDQLCQVAQTLAAELLPIAMTGHPRSEGEDVMRLNFHAIPKPSEDLLGHHSDAAKDGVRLWLLGSNTE